MSLADSRFPRSPWVGRVLPGALACMWLAACVSGGRSPADNAMAGRQALVGTVVRIDADASTLSLADDTQTGNAMGQGSATNLRYTPGTEVFAEGRSAGPTSLAVGNRVRVLASNDGRPPTAERVDVLHAPAQALPWGHYLHGRVVSINTASSTVTVAQAKTNISVRVRYEPGTRVVEMDGRPVAPGTLAPGDELDIALRLVTPDRVASRVVRLR